MGEADLAVVILAAGEGTRMRSRRPKVLHPVCGRSLLGHAIATSRELGARHIVCVLGHGEADVRASLGDEPVEIALQSERKGTGHAVLQTRTLLEGHDGPVLVVYADHPLFRSESLRSLVETWRRESADLAVLVAEYPDRSDFGRIVRGSDGRLERIVEFHEATPEIRALREVNLGVYVLERELLFRTLDRVTDDNEKGEYYLPGIVPLILGDGGSVTTSSLPDWDEAMGVNSMVDLARAERVMRQRIAERWMLHGVSFRDPERTYVDAGVTIEADTVLAPGVSLLGDTSIGADCRIDDGVVIEDSSVADGVWIKPNCRLERASVGRGCIIGPSAHLRPDARLAEDVRIGNFVEIKNSNLGRGTKADHLSYVGDSDVGEDVSIGCGAITVNYDSEEKTRTTIGDGAFVGCNVNLIAPVVVEAGAYVAAGSTITKPVPGRALGIARAKQRNIEGWRDRRFGADGEDE
jgi:bifunctional UDP-N-acetylglucosamine pyrophosphorylase/glucosamine-1-phosphate N-acetyltransferase